MTKTDNSLLIKTATPVHRPQYQGELGVMLGSRYPGPGRVPAPGGLSVTLRSSGGTRAAIRSADGHGDVKTSAQVGGWRLITEKGRPIMLHSDSGAIALADLSSFTGVPLAAELASIMEKLLAGYDPVMRTDRQTVRFRALAGFNDLMVGVAWQYLGISRVDTLAALLRGAISEAAEQTTWYRRHGPRLEDGETWEQYKAEMTGFTVLAGEYKTVTRAQLAVTGNGGSR